MFYVVPGLLPDERFGSTRHVGSYWNRASTIQVDLVGGDTRPVAREIAFLGSIKWRESRPFDRTDTATLIGQRAQVPGAGAATKLVGIAREGFAPDAGLDLALSARDIIDAYR